MSSEAVFQANLKTGMQGEDIAYSYLVQHNSFVEDCRNKYYVDGVGPRLRGTEGALVLPDFTVFNKDPRKGCFAVDVKVKTSIYPVNGKMCFTVDNKYEQYLRVVQLKKLDYLQMIFIYNGRMHSYKDSECLGSTVFGNQYGNGLVYLFEYSADKVVY